jgi:hypothetical protein
MESAEAHAGVDKYIVVLIRRFFLGPAVEADGDEGPNWSGRLYNG